MAVTGAPFASSRPTMRKTTKLSQTVEYALIVLAQLSYGPTSSPTLYRDMLKAGTLPEKYLKEVLRTLVARDLAISSRGANGGYWLARPARHITLLEVIIAFEGPLEGVSDELTTFIGESGSRKIRQAVACHAHTATDRLHRISLADLA
jgi:Rrf2 family protein